MQKYQLPPAKARHINNMQNQLKIMQYKKKSHHK